MDVNILSTRVWLYDKASTFRDRWGIFDLPEVDEEDGGPDQREKPQEGERRDRHVAEASEAREQEVCEPKEQEPDNAEPERGVLVVDAGMDAT